MIYLTQTHEGEFGNCWQTAIACILELPAEKLPDQHVIEMAQKARVRAQCSDDGTNSSHGPGAPAVPEYFAGQFSYMSALNAYLGKHHGLVYCQDYAWRLAPFQFRDPGWHLALGPTSRNSLYHCVVALRGETVWDTNPSRSGLSAIDQYGWLVPETGPARATREARGRMDLAAWGRRSEKSPSIGYLCCCPECFVDGEYL